LGGFALIDPLEPGESQKPALGLSGAGFFYRIFFIVYFFLFQLPGSA